MNKEQMIESLRYLADLLESDGDKFGHASMVITRGIRQVPNGEWLSNEQTGQTAVVLLLNAGEVPEEVNACFRKLLQPNCVEPPPEFEVLRKRY